MCVCVCVCACVCVCVWYSNAKYHYKISSLPSYYYEDIILRVQSGKIVKCRLLVTFQLPLILAVSALLVP